MDADVVVVGAGPTGLLLAGDLAEAGMRVTVLERRENESNVTRAFAVHARTMEEFDIRGVADELTKTGTTIRRLRLFDRVQSRRWALGWRYPAPRGADRRVGTRAPDIPLTSGRLFEALRGGRFVLVGADALSIERPPQVDAAVPVRGTGQLVLVRPDGYVAWVGTAAQFPAWARHYFRR